MTDTIPLHKSDCALLIGGYQCTCGFRQRQNKTPPALAAEQPKPEPVRCNPAAMRTAASSPAVLFVTELDQTDDAEALRRENERLREALNRFEYSSDGHIKRYPEEEEVIAALRREET